MSDKADLQELLKVVCTFLARPESEPFRRPVDWKALGLTDYPAIVKRPMDLGRPVIFLLPHTSLNMLLLAICKLQYT